ncbi:MAG: hypothetical protein LBQ54_06020 [Planctomycetaceae bacterium]|jgi:hypothetical protein|nr:hypothetical protein [Planctomycetaceae bacterium]
MKHRIFLILLSAVVMSAAGCPKAPKPSSPDSPGQSSPEKTDAPEKTVSEPDTDSIVLQIEAVFGEVERDRKGTLIGVNLAKGRSSVPDEILQQALLIPNLRKLRAAGGTVSQETLGKIAGQKSLEELYLQDTPVRDADLQVILSGLPKLTRLTLRSSPNVTDQGISHIAAHSRLKSLSLIGIPLSRAGLEEILRMKTVKGLDLRDCSSLTSEDYTLLAGMPQLTDLKVGGFSITDEVLKTMVKLPNLTGLTIDDAMISPAGFAEMASNKDWAAKITTLVFNRDMQLFDEAMLSLRHFPNLRRLTICDMMVSGEFLEKLAAEETARPKLETLSLRKTLLTLEGVTALKKYRELTSLDLSCVSVTPEMMEILNRLDSLKTLNLECQ